MHFNDYALYTLQPVNAPGGSLRTGAKTTFCVMDTTPINLGCRARRARRSTAGAGAISRACRSGGAIPTAPELAGQEIDFTGNADGIYQLKIEVDPKKVLLETNENDNVSCVLLSIKKPSTVTVLDSSGQCFVGGVDHPEFGARGHQRAGHHHRLRIHRRAWASVSMAATAHGRSPATCS